MQASVAFTSNMHNKKSQYFHFRTTEHIIVYLTTLCSALKYLGYFDKHALRQIRENESIQ